MTLFPDSTQASPAECSSRILGFMKSENYDEAWRVCQQALAQHPDSPELLVSAASLLMKRDEAAEAESYVARAAALRPESPVIWNNLGLALRNQNRIAESLRCFEKAIALEPAWARAHYDRAFSLLLAGEYLEGFREYEHRWQANGLERPGDDDPALCERLWRGQNLRGKRILVYAEQGLGDTIQFVRYVAALQAQGAEVILEVQPVLRVLAPWLRPGCELGKGDGLVPFDFHCPLMTLPLYLGTKIDTIPLPAAFRVPEEMSAKWQTIIPATEEFRIGLVWAGNPGNPMDDRRSTRFSTFQPLLEDDFSSRKTRFYSFQIGSRAGDIDEDSYRGKLVDLNEKLSAATETAAALTRMDLVVTVDTFAGHLAASLGIPVWLLLPFAPDWRWLLGRDDSPWYSSVRLFRQSVAGDWAGVAVRVRDELRHLLNSG